MTRDIVDYEGNIIGKLTLPDDTSEEVWKERLSPYLALPPAPPTPEELALKAARGALRLGRTLLTELSARNIQMGIIQSGKLKEIIDYTGNLQLYLSSGALPAAIEELTTLMAGPIPPELAPFVTLETMTDTRARIADAIGAPVPATVEAQPAEPDGI